MLYVLYGTNTDKLRAKVHVLVDTLLDKKPDAAHVRFDAETFTPDVLSEYTQAQGLFTGRAIVVLDKIFDAEEGKQSVLDGVKYVADSENVFILIEENIDAKSLKKIEKYARQVQHFERKKSVKKEDAFNVFSLTDALGNRDKKKLWTLYQKAIRTNAVPEELHGILFWQVKTMLLVSQKETKDLKPFAVSKAKKFIQNYSEEELQKLARNLVELYHDTRRGFVEFPIALEQFILSI